jgi:hypothetical protein
MASLPNRPLKAPRRSPSIRGGDISASSGKGTNWILWILLGIVLVAGISVVVWRLQYQAEWQKTDDKIMALLESADQLIQANREDEAEAVARQGLGLLPGDQRCQKMIERIQTKRQMIQLRKAEVSNAVLAQAEEFTRTDISLALEALEKMVVDASMTPESQKTARERIARLKGGVCSLRLPSNWPGEAVLTLNGKTQRVVEGLVEGIVPGKYDIKITRHGFSDPPVMTLDFRGVDPVSLPAFGWKPRGAKVFVKSIPPGAAVWWKGKNTGKTTPFEIDDVDDGPVEFILKHPKYAETSVKGQVEDRKPISLTATLEPLNEPSP